MHTPADMARFWSHPDIVPLREAVRKTNPLDRTAYKTSLNSIRDKIAELKEREQ